MPKILIVDDEVQLQEIYATFFKEQGFTDLMFASDGLEAYELCSKHKFDMITLDHQMPFMLGADFLKALRLKPGINQNTAVLMISAFIPQVDPKCQAFENTFFFDKPVDFEKVVKYARMITKNTHAIAS